MDSTLPFYRQISGKLFLLTLSFSIVLGVAFALYYFQTKQLDSVTSKQLPKIIKFNQQKALIINQFITIDRLLSGEQATALKKTYQELESNLQNISRTTHEHSGLFEQLLQRHQSQQNNVYRLSENYSRDNQLKENAVIQLTLVLDSLNVQVTIQTRQQRALERQVKSGKLTDKIMAIRAKALSAISIQLNQNQQIKLRLINALVLFEQLNLQYDVQTYDFIQNQTSTDVTAWLENVVKRRDDGATDRKLVTQMRALNELLFGQFNVFSKWRSQLRMSSEFHETLAEQKEQLLPLLTQKMSIALPQKSRVEKQITTWFARYDLEMKKHYVQWFAIGAAILFFLLFITIVFLTKRKVRLLGNASIKTVKSFINQDFDGKQVPSEEMSEIVKLLNQLSQPEHSESDYQRQQRIYQQRLACLSLHSGTNFWCLPKLPIESEQSLLTLLAIERFGSHWKQCFSRNDVKRIIKSARIAKDSKCHQQLEITTDSGQLLLLSIAYQDHIWFGTLSLADKLQQAAENQQSLEQKIVNLTDENIKFHQLINSNIVNRVTTAMLTYQQRSIGGELNENIEYQQLTQLFIEGYRYKMLAKFAQNTFRLDLAQVNFIKEIHCAVNNMNNVAVLSNSNIILNVDPHIVESVTIDTSLFHYLLSEIVSIIVVSQQQVRLTLDISVVEKAKAQQVIQFGFTATQISKVNTLKSSLEMIGLTEENTQYYTDIESGCIRNVMQKLNINRQEITLIDDGIKFLFDLPVALTSEANVADSNVIDFKDTSMLLLATDKNNSSKICNILALANAKPEVLKDVSLFQRQLSIKHLTNHKIDVVLLSPEVYLSDYDVIEQYIASLPVHLQPQLMVIQPDVNTPMYRTGIFSINDSPLLPFELNSKLYSLVCSEDKSNLVISGELLAQCRHGRSQVEVLLAVKSPLNNQLLLRLLRWLGLQVTVVSQQQCQEEQWQTGRYLVLISEFSSTSLKIMAEPTVLRGVFTINTLDSAEIECEQVDDLPECWILGALPSALDILSLNKALQPWLKPSKNRVASNESKLTVKATKSIVPTLSDDTSDENILSLDILQSEFGDVHECEQEFNLFEFAQNQGSVQLAALMLDEYIEEIGSKLANMTTALENVEIHALEDNLKQLIKLTQIIAAKPLEEGCQSFVNDLNLLTLSDLNDDDDKQLLTENVTGLHKQYAQLIEFAQAI